MAEEDQGTQEANQTPVPMWKGGYCVPGPAPERPFQEWSQDTVLPPEQVYNPETLRWEPTEVERG